MYPILSPRNDSPIPSQVTSFQKPPQEKKNGPSYKQQDVEHDNSSGSTLVEHILILTSQANRVEHVETGAWGMPISATTSGSSVKPW